MFSKPCSLPASDSSSDNAPADSFIEAIVERTSSRHTALFGLLVVVGMLALPIGAQTNPTPNTFSTLAGGYSGTYVVGGTCGGTGSGSKLTALDTLGNGCPTTQAILGPSLSGIGVDGAGNVFVNDYSNGQVRRIDARTGIVTKVIGTSNTVCSATTSATGTKQDTLGSGCVNTSALGPANARGMNVDPWGNVILGSYNTSMVNIICLATSPLCPGTANRKQVGSFYRIAGCVPSQGGGATAASGTTAGSGGDNSLASPFQNLSGDVAAWGLTGAAATAATVGTAGSCATTSGGVNSARNAQADKFGNVYIADTGGDRYRVVLGPASYNGLTNPLFAIINMNPQYTANEGYIYTILGSFSPYTSGGGTTYNIPTAAGQACSSASSTIKATDTLGDGCLFFETGKPAGSSPVAGIGVDKDGNPIFSDNVDSAVRVLYVGGTAMANIISANNGGITPVVGTVYAIEGTGTASKGATPELNVSSASISTGNTKVAVDGAQNIYLSDGTGVNIIDSTTGYLRRPISAGGTKCSGGATNGDGCATGNGASFTSLSSVGVAIAVDNLGNLLLADSAGLVRKVFAGTLYPTAVGSTFTQNVVFHEPAGTTGVTATLLNASPGISIPSAAPSCTLFNSSSDNTADCTVVVTFTPTVPGKVGATLSITNIGGGGGTTLYPLVGQATDAALVTDVASPTTSVVTTSLTIPTSLAIDSGGNYYSIDTSSSGSIYRNGTSIASTAPAGANQIAVDTTGNVYVTGVGNGSVTKYALGASGAYTTSTFTVPAVAKPQGIAFDVQGNMYLSDATTASVYEVPNNAGFAGLQATTAVATGLANPNLLAIDGLGNLLIADTGIVYRVNSTTGALSTVASASAGGVVLSGLTPIGLAGDAGGNVYVQDSSSKKIYEIPYQIFAPGSVTVLTGETTPNGIAVDGKGQIYAADSGRATPAILKVARASASYTFPTSTTTYNGTFTNTGNANSTGYAQTDSTEFPFTGTGSGGCGSISGTSVLTTGSSCIFSVTPNLGNNGQLVTNTTTLVPSTSLGSLALTAQEASGTTYNTTTTVTGPSTAVYVGSGPEATFNVAEVASDTTSQNGEAVKVSIDSGATVNYTLSGGSVNVPVSALTVGSHTITATYPGDGTYLSSAGNTMTFSITQASTTTTWTPGTTSQQYSAAIGNSVLDAAANVPGAFIYTATPSGGSAQSIHAASYLPIGTYSLGVTFVPNDSLDYAQSTASVSTYTVSQATTTALIGGSQNVVGATGNYSSVQAAINALPVTGGSVYIQPGTYTGDVSVTQPNVALRGLGGDPTKVIITHPGGAFSTSSGSVYSYAGEFNTSITNGYQLPAGSTLFNSVANDAGSATLVVARGVNTAVSSSTTTPNGFYGENFTLNNTWDTDSTLTTTYVSAGVCTASAGTAMTYSALYNAGTECASQALAIWITSDLAVLNNVYTASLQDTVYAGAISTGSAYPARQFWFRGKITGDVDYIFGDAAVVFDHTSIYSAYHSTAGGTVTIEAQNKAALTGSSGDYLSGYVMNSDVFTSQNAGMSSLYFGRPYGTYSTWIMLNSYIDQVNSLGYIPFSGSNALTDATYGEYNDQTYTDPSNGSPDINGVIFVGTSAASSGSGVLPTSARESASTDPGYTAFSANGTNSVGLTQAQAQQFYPLAFLGKTITTNQYNTVATWDPTAAIASDVNAFVPGTSPTSINYGQSITLLMRPRTPGLGAVSNGSYTIPTGTYTLYDNATQIANGSLDASGEATYNSSTLTPGNHSFTWTYGGDTNFAGSSTSSAYALSVVGTSTVTTLSSNNTPTYGQAASITATVSANTGTPTGTVTLTIDGASTLTGTLSSGTYTFSVTGLLAGSHSFSASYAGAGAFTSSSTTSSLGVSIGQATLTVTASCSSRVYGAPNVCSAVLGTFQYSDSASSVFTGTHTGTTTALRDSPANTYTATPLTASLALNNFGAANYTLSPSNSTFTISGGAPQSILFAPLPNFPNGGSYQLTASTTSGLPVSYTVTLGNANITNGSTLNVTGTGLVTVQASQNTDPTGDYAAATPVSRSFTAQ